MPQRVYAREGDRSIFVGWFATPQMSHKFDFSQAVTEDTSVFAGFVTYVEDTREFAIVGSGTSPVLLESNWGAVIGDAQKMMTKEERQRECIRSRRLKRGDQFQFAMDSPGEISAATGISIRLNWTAWIIFENSGSLGDTGVKRSNIKCAVAGNYTFTLTTYPGEDTYETDNANYTEENRGSIQHQPVRYDHVDIQRSIGECRRRCSDRLFHQGVRCDRMGKMYSDETRVYRNGMDIHFKD